MQINYVLIIFHLLIYTGARKGEVLALTWDDIDLEAGSIHFNKTLFFHKGEFLYQTSKTRESRRLIILGSHALSLLNKWRIRQKKRI